MSSEKEDLAELVRSSVRVLSTDERHLNARREPVGDDDVDTGGDARRAVGDG